MEEHCELCSEPRASFHDNYCIEHIHLSICEAVARIKNGTAVKDIAAVAALAQRLAREA